MALTKIETTDLTSTLANTIATAASEAAAAIAAAGPKIANVQIANSSWSALDDTAIDLAGGYFIINGSGFQSNVVVLIDNSTPSSVSRVSESVLRVSIGSKAAGSYNIQLFNPDGGTAILVNGLTFSATPTWVTTSPLTSGNVDVSYTVSLNATDATSYTLQAGSSLPPGFTLAANGVLSGTVSGLATTTSYTFTVVATDAQNQDSPRTFSVTIVAAPVYQLFVWGQNSSGALGLNDTNNRSSPVQLGAADSWSSLLEGRFQDITGGVKNGQLWLSGLNTSGQLGVGDRNSRSSPVQVGALTNWAKVACSNYNDIFAIKTDGTLWAWGSNAEGRLGLSDTVARSSPTQVGSDTNWSTIAAFGVVVATKTNGTFWTWGHDPTGNPTMPSDYVPAAKRSSPVQVGSDTNWADAKMGFFTGIALKTNGTVWLWGRDAGYGVTGGLSPDNNNAITLTQLGTQTNWSKIHAGFLSHGAIKTTGALWLWGYNSYGKLGLNSETTVYSPVQLGSSSWNSISGYDMSVGIRSDGTLWLWGGQWANYNATPKTNYGFGNNTKTNYSSPVQIGTATNWYKAECGVASFLAAKES